MSQSTVTEKRTVITSSSSSGGGYEAMEDIPYKSNLGSRSNVISRSSLPLHSSGGTNLVRTMEYNYGSSMGGMGGGYPGHSSNTGVTNVKTSREKEKKDLRDLNERFANYIEKVRFLEAQNRKLGGELDELRSKWGKETSHIKQMYEAELAEARRLIDDLSKDKAALEIKTSSIVEQNNDINRQLDEAKKYRNQDREQINKLNQQLADYESEINMLRRSIESLETEKQRDKATINRLQHEVDKFRIDLSNETLAHLDAENRRQTLEEEMEFMKKVHEQELKELAALAYRDTTAENREFWKSELAQAIRDIQNEYDSKVDQLRGDMEAFYNLKIQEYRTGATKQNMEVTHIREENKKMVKQMSDMRGKLADMEARCAQFEKQYQDVLRELEGKDTDHMMETTQLREEISKQRAEMESILTELQTLMDAKLSLELEIAAYRKLLEGEENRIDWRSRATMIMYRDAFVPRTSFERSNRVEVKEKPIELKSEPIVAAKPEPLDESPDTDAASSITMSDQEMSPKDEIPETDITEVAEMDTGSSGMWQKVDHNGEQSYKGAPDTTEPPSDRLVAVKDEVKRIEGKVHDVTDGAEESEEPEEHLEASAVVEPIKPEIVAETQIEVTVHTTKSKPLDILNMDKTSSKDVDIKEPEMHSTTNEPIAKDSTDISDSKNRDNPETEDLKTTDITDLHTDQKLESNETDTTCDERTVINEVDSIGENSDRKDIPHEVKAESTLPAKTGEDEVSFSNEQASQNVNLIDKRDEMIIDETDLSSQTKVSGDTTEGNQTDISSPEMKTAVDISETSVAETSQAPESKQETSVETPQESNIIDTKSTGSSISSKDESKPEEIESKTVSVEKEGVLSPGNLDYIAVEPSKEQKTSDNIDQTSLTESEHTEDRTDFAQTESVTEQKTDTTDDLVKGDHQAEAHAEQTTPSKESTMHVVTDTETIESIPSEDKIAEPALKKDDKESNSIKSELQTSEVDKEETTQSALSNVDSKTKTETEIEDKDLSMITSEEEGKPSIEQEILVKSEHIDVEAKHDIEVVDQAKIGESIIEHHKPSSELPDKDTSKEKDVSIVTPDERSIKPSAEQEILVKSDHIDAEANNVIKEVDSSTLSESMIEQHKPSSELPVKEIPKEKEESGKLSVEQESIVKSEHIEVEAKHDVEVVDPTIMSQQKSSSPLPGTDLSTEKEESGKLSVEQESIVKIEHIEVEAKHDVDVVDPTIMSQSTIEQQKSSSPLPGTDLSTEKEESGKLSVEQETLVKSKHIDVESKHDIEVGDLTTMSQSTTEQQKPSSPLPVKDISKENEIQNVIASSDDLKKADEINADKPDGDNKTAVDEQLPEKINDDQHIVSPKSSSNEVITETSHPVRKPDSLSPEALGNTEDKVLETVVTSRIIEKSPQEQTLIVEASPTKELPEPFPESEITTSNVELKNEEITAEKDSSEILQLSGAIEDIKALDTTHINKPDTDKTDIDHIDEIKSTETQAPLTQPKQSPVGSSLEIAQSLPSREDAQPVEQTTHAKLEGVSKDGSYKEKSTDIASDVEQTQVSELHHAEKLDTVKKFEQDDATNVEHISKQETSMEQASLVESKLKESVEQKSHTEQASTIINDSKDTTLQVSKSESESISAASTGVTIEHSSLVNQTKDTTRVSEATVKQVSSSEMESKKETKSDITVKEISSFEEKKALHGTSLTEVTTTDIKHDESGKQSSDSVSTSPEHIDSKSVVTAHISTASSVTSEESRAFESIEKSHMSKTVSETNQIVNGNVDDSPVQDINETKAITNQDSKLTESKTDPDVSSLSSTDTSAPKTDTMTDEQKSEEPKVNGEGEHVSKSLVESQEGLNEKIEKILLNGEDSQVSMKMMRGEVSAKTTYQRTSTGPIAISEVAADGKHIILENTSSGPKRQDVNLDGWKLKRTVDGTRDYVYNFRNFTLKAGKAVKILARSAASEAGLNDLVFRDEDTWGSGSQVNTRLINDRNEEKASHVQKTLYN